MGGDHAHTVIGTADDDGCEPVPIGDEASHGLEARVVVVFERQRVDRLVGEDGELREVDRPGALAEHAALGATLPPVVEERPGILEGVRTRGVGRERLVRREGKPIAGEDVAEAALGDGDERDRVDAVLEGTEEVPATPHHLGLEAGLTAEREEAIGDGPKLGREQLFHDARAVVGDVADGAADAGQQQQEHEEHGAGGAQHQNGFDHGDTRRGRGKNEPRSQQN